MKKTALVTGSSRGLGLAIAKTLSCVGYQIILTGRNQNELMQAQKHNISCQMYNEARMCFAIKVKQ